MAPPDSVVYLDTHVVAWLYAGRVELLPTAARDAIDEHALLFSPVVGLELQYLRETDRLTEPAEPILEALSREIGLRPCELPFHEVALAAVREGWTRDPFNRILVAQAKLRGSSLLTKDRRIHLHYDRAVWD